MREIEFRGQRIDNGEWVYGYVSKTRRLNKPDQLFEEMVYHIEDLVDKMILEQVKPESIGQFTGLTDKNGNKIFEGDIDKSGMIIMFHNNAFQLCSLVFKEVIQAIPLWCFDNKTFDQIEIIGNIHEDESV